MISGHLIHMVWEKPKLSFELHEFERTAEELNIDIDLLKSAFKTGQIKTLSTDIWKKLENTDSWNTKTMADVEKLANEYNKDLNSIMKAKKLPMPIVLKRKNNYYLIAGNTRLMYCRANKIIPEIFLITL